MTLALEPWWRDTWWVAERDRALQIAQMVRTEARFEVQGGAEASLGELDRRVSLLVKPDAWGLVVDLRAVPLRVSPDDHAGVQRFNAIIFRFGRVAVVVRTAVGRMQMQRVARQAPILVVFDDPAEAAADLIAWQLERRAGRQGGQ